MIDVKIFYEGFLAFDMGKSLDTCPYSDEAEKKTWEDGYETGRKNKIRADYFNNLL